MSLRVVPVRFRDACGFVEMWHRHHEPLDFHVFSLGVADESDVLRGVAMVGRPVARSLDDGLTLEVNRTATDGTANANSMLYGAAWRAAKALGYRRLITYTQADETGVSLRAAGWRVVAERPARSGWSHPSRPREDKGTAYIPRMLWEVTACGAKGAAMADHPSLDAIERDVLTEVGVLLGREAGLADWWPDGEPWSPTCRHHGPRHRRMRHREVRMSYGVIGLWCRACDASPSDVRVPEGWA